MKLIVWRYKDQDQWYLYYNGESGLASDAQREIPLFIDDSVADSVKALALQNDVMHKAGQCARKEYGFIELNGVLTGPDGERSAVLHV